MATLRTDGAPGGVFAAFCASLVGIGLARFAYTPLLPAVVSSGWFDASAAAYLGAANLAGYLAGALGAGALAGRISGVSAPRATMLLASATFFASCAPVSFAWFFLWRFASGVAGGALMVLAAPAVLPHVAPGRRGAAAGAIFAGVGLGIAASGLLVPPLLRLGLFEAWLALGALCLALTAAAWPFWPENGPAPEAGARPARADRRLLALYGLYALAAVGLVPHMVFLVDFVARGLSRGIGAGGRLWVLFGLAAVAGPPVAGRIADRIGFSAALRLAFALEAAAVALPLLDSGPASLAVSAVLVGAFVPGIVPLALGRIGELTGGDAAARADAWSIATAAFALGQAASAYLCSFLFTQGGGYGALFLLGAAAMLAALAVELVAGGGKRS